MSDASEIDKRLLAMMSPSDGTMGGAHDATTIATTRLLFRTIGGKRRAEQHLGVHFQHRAMLRKKPAGDDVKMPFHNLPHYGHAQ